MNLHNTPFKISKSIFWGITQPSRVSYLRHFRFHTKPREEFYKLEFTLYKSCLAIFIQAHSSRASRLQNRPVPVLIMRYSIHPYMYVCVYKYKYLLRRLCFAPRYKCGKLFYGFRLKIALNTRTAQFPCPLPHPLLAPQWPPGRHSALGTKYQVPNTSLYLSLPPLSVNNRQKKTRFYVFFC